MCVGAKIVDDRRGSIDGNLVIEEEVWESDIEEEEDESVDIICSDTNLESV